MVAASGIAGIAYLNQTPQDIVAPLHHLRQNAAARRIDPARIGVWACSGNVPTALALMAREPLVCAALLYGYMLDLDGATSVAEAVAQFHFAVPAVSLAEIPHELPLLVVRAGPSPALGDVAAPDSQRDKKLLSDGPR